ncbi:pilus assembly protein N-terminal domain-containing protein [Stieleria sp. JC731]|uniref:type II and III secretion system protein family protein n=1 Tax=Pirellulaceae TaxID=2691357 RepID=UPI001E449A7D|nr:pilus assembly protein N-terminal domain-containing protein [Stieleria sp. JC731]MCC9602737.1 pilus assembly protein N-terminal domain-containing protein [Stieleria sp. JC731]
MIPAIIVVFAVCATGQQKGMAQALASRPVADKSGPLENPSQISIEKENSLIEEIYEPEMLLRVEPSQSKIIRTKVPVRRTAITDPNILDIHLFDDDEIEIIGKEVGETTITFWFEVPGKGTQVLRYYVEVDNAQQEQRRREARYKSLQSRINELFPNSQIFLFPIDDKVIVRGQARDAKEAAEIMRLLGDNPYNRNQYDRVLGRVADDADIDDHDDHFDDLDSSHFINLLRVPGEQQVMLKVRVAELVRNSSRGAGANFSSLVKSLDLSSTITGGSNLSVILDDGDVEFFLSAIATHGYGKVLAEPTLVTISGKPARFIAGGEFAVPTTVGVNGVGAATTTFRGFGTELNFTPTVTDKDLVRLEVAPSFSTLNSDATVGGIPGLNLRRVETTVDLREGQWLAIAGLIQEEQGGQKTRVPYLGDLPMLGQLFSSRQTSRFETELVVLVSPELVHPLETDEVPLFLPGMHVTDPTDADFFARQMIEGYEGFDHRSTVWPEVAQQRLGQDPRTVTERIKTSVKRTLARQKAYLAGECGVSQ